MESTEKALKKQILSFYATHDLPLNTPQLIAFSGGCDSVALLYLLKEIALEQYGSVSHLRAAYYNHNLRTPQELDHEVRFIKDVTSQWSIPLSLGEALPEQLDSEAQLNNRSLEDVARDYRYEFLERELEEHNLSYLVLAHHSDDQLETLVTRFFQGSGLSGLAGIKPVNKNRLRPILTIPKDRLKGLLEEKDIPWSQDSSNSETQFQRNKIRHNLLPTLTEAFPGLHRSLVSLSEKVSRADSYLAKVGAEQPWLKGDHRYTLTLEYYNSLDPVIREYTVYHILDELLRGRVSKGRRGNRIPYRFLKPLFDKSLSSHFKLEGHGVLFSCEGGVLSLSFVQSYKLVNYFFILEWKKPQVLPLWQVEWKETVTPEDKNVVLLVEKGEDPQIRTTTAGRVVVETERGVVLAKWNGLAWKIVPREILQEGRTAVHIREL